MGVRTGTGAMPEHLSPEYVGRYLQRSLTRDERTAADAHLASCDVCQRQIVESPDLQAAFFELQSDLTAHGEITLSHLTFEQMESYVDGTMSDWECEIVESHSEVCRVCGGELSDLQSFRSAEFVNDRSLRGSTANDTAEIMAAAADISRRPQWKSGQSWKWAVMGATAIVIASFGLSIGYFRTAPKMAHAPSVEVSNPQHSVQKGTVATCMTAEDKLETRAA